MKLRITGDRARLNIRHVNADEHASPLLDDQRPFTVFINPSVAHSRMGVVHSDCVMTTCTDRRYDTADTVAHPPIGIELGDGSVGARN